MGRKGSNVVGTTSGQVTRWDCLLLKTKNLYRFIRLLHGEISDGGTSERVKEQEESESRWPFGASPAFLEKANGRTQVRENLLELRRLA